MVTVRETVVSECVAERGRVLCHAQGWELIVPPAECILIQYIYSSMVEFRYFLVFSKMTVKLKAEHKTILSKNNNNYNTIRYKRKASE